MQAVYADAATASRCTSKLTCVENVGNLEVFWQVQGLLPL